ncbi:uncharacterized protein (TIGR01440 family) [Gracilibacillus halotolerans]|uniref:UPF0340 protein GGQ92_003084 n=1 Tax=Gracilibacillus halotolerans TaxID=74386 RepID=A0A841RN52_9BACI|nr:TIGR01440 family protein [Gracilibacillus halotolerans]MBB6514261.1 uncharacterized protein (TIGR01440 family) [Gracilibacillus halotolerans]
MQLEQWRTELRTLVDEWIDSGYLAEGNLFIIGCSTSEVAGERIGTAGSEDIAAFIFDELQRLKEKTGVALCFQCCEHLNRAIVMERATMERKQLEPVAVRPVRTAGGAMAEYAYNNFDEPAVVEAVQADAGIDIGETMIGMHLKAVAVPLRFSEKYIGHARVTHARTRPKLIGGPRAVYPE